MDGCSEEELSDKQRLLNVKYDAFVKQYGAITSKANRIAFRDDSDYPLLCSLEAVSYTHLNLFCEKCAHARKKVVQNHENTKTRLKF